MQPFTLNVAAMLVASAGLLLAFSARPSIPGMNQRRHYEADIQLIDRPQHLHNNILFLKRATARKAAILYCNKSSQDKVTGVTLKMAFDASSLWGVAETSPTSERFTSPQSLDMVHRLRRESSAVLVGRSTVERDDCSLTVRRVEMDGEQPVRVVLDPDLKLLNGKQYSVLNDGIRTIIYHAVSNVVKEGSTIQGVISDSVTLVELKRHCVSNNSDEITQQHTLSPKEIIQDLSSRGLNHIMVEGGPTTARLFLDDNLIDRAILVRAPIQFKTPIPAGFNEEKLKEAGLVLIGNETMGGDTVEYWVREGMEWPTKDLTSWP
jgi:riboflavin-specific deaminase-like protein